MAKQPELWAFVLANMLLFVVSSLLTVLSYFAYRRSDGESSFLTAAVGFGFVVLGGLVEPMYQLVIRGEPALNGAELMWLQAGEGVLIASGLGLLFFAITRHDSGSPSVEDDRFPLTDGSSYEFDQQADG